jgi:hypothetical protein
LAPQRAKEAYEHTADFGEMIIQGSEFRLRDDLEIARNDQVVFEFTHRARGDLQTPKEFPGRRLAAAFGDVRGDRRSRSNGLGAKA